MMMYAYIYKIHDSVAILAQAFPRSLHPSRTKFTVLGPMTVHLAFVLLAHATVVGAIRADCDSLNVHTFLPPKALALLEPFGWTVGTDPEICVCDLQARLDDLAPKLVQLHPDHGGECQVSGRA